MFWCDGFMPVAPRNLRVLPGIGAALFTAANPPNVVCFDFYNIGSTPYAVVFLSDGSVVQVTAPGGVVTTILAAGSIANPVITQVGVAQYGSQYLIIVANQPNGYWVWDGVHLFTAGTLAPTITLTNPGSAYVSSPSVQFSGGSGSGAAASASIANGSVTNIAITNPGSGYQAGDVVTVTLVGGTQAGSGAALTAVLSSAPGGSGANITITWGLVFSAPNVKGYYIQSINIISGGSGYSSLATATWHTPSGFNDFWNTTGGVPPSISLTVTGGVITGVTINPLGSPSNNIWDTGDNKFPTITVSDPVHFTVTSVTGTPTGTNYSPSTTITASGGGSGSGEVQAVITPVIVGGVITGTTIQSGGVYDTNVAPTLTVNDVAITATATASLMPFGLRGTCVETYAGHVWIANGPTITFSAPGSVSNFATSAGGGTFTSSDSFLRVGYTRLLQTNGFLFLIGDSSMNYISGVQTNTPQGGNPTTTFTNNNSDPEDGTPYPASVTTLGTDIFMANQNGVYVSTGGTFQKKSEPLDGVYNSAADTFAGLQLSSAKDLIFGKVVYMVLVPIIDPVSKTTRNKLFMFNEKYWWSSEQDVTLTFIQAQEFNSVFQSYGTDGTHIYPLFTTPSVGFTKTMQTKLWDAPAGYDFTKTSTNLFAIAQFQGAAQLTYNVYVDNEKGATGRAGPYVHAGVTGDNETFSIMPPTAVAQMGVLTGMTVQTTADDLQIVSIALQDQIVGYRA